MDQEFSFRELPLHSKYAFVGNILLIAGSVAVSMSALLKLATLGDLSDRNAFNPGGFNQGSGNQSSGSSRTRDYFT